MKKFHAVKFNLNEEISHNKIQLTSIIDMMKRHYNILICIQPN